MPTDRFPELTACNAAKAAVDEFDAKYASKATAMKRIAQMLERGGWGAVAFEEDTPYSPGSRRISPDIEPVALASLAGASIESIVRQRRALVQQWEAAYQAVPEAIRASASSPTAKLYERQRRR
jgi:hypothetical protein